MILLTNLKDSLLDFEKQFFFFFFTILWNVIDQNSVD